MARHVVLLRGINVGGNRKVAMPELRAVLQQAGHKDVATYVQSGNVVLTSRMGPERLAREIEGQIAAALGVAVDVLVRTRDELADVIERLPWDDVQADKRLHVCFLWDELSADVAAGLQSEAHAPDRAVVDGREVFVWYPDGMQGSGLAKLMTDRKLGVKGTDRNWNTVTRLLAMADEA